MSTTPEKAPATRPGDSEGRSLLLLWGWIVVKVILLVLLTRHQTAAFIYGGF